MRILVTGGCGFIGSNFILKQLLNKENEILNFDKLTYAGNLDNLESITNNTNYQFIQGDICDITTVSKTISNFCPDALINFAAESHVDRSIDDPINFVKTNILGTAALLEASTNYFNNLNNRKFKFLHVSTDEVYGSLSNHGLFTENSNYDPSSPYSASKAGSDHLVRAWNRTYDLPTFITNCSNNYGPYQFIEKLVPLMILNCIDEKPLPIYGEGLNIRDWLYVEDHCDAIMNVLKNGNIGETYNIGGNNEIRNIDMVTTICSLLDQLKPRENGKPYNELITYVPDRPGHDFRYAIDSSKIKNGIGWLPKETFKTGIAKTIKWYLDNESWWRNILDNNYSQDRLGLKKN
ncbi:MAG: dTDP-glucose 4,6-dehydratase [Candidatus Marinimicrobia bacterium]|nr:dTDP-glucose 4,6-dehydratase [Candidatus Neomarinimicrobiota bacterium]|tara:strand:- start:6247 stop:7296 length:1050 start_codon:yes stop_codon:yes gene_type:complete